MKQLTQAVFDGAPDWVMSAAVDSDGDAYYYSVSASELTLDSDECWWLYIGVDGRGYGDDYAGDGYDATNWKNSAIDREVTK